MNWNTLAQKKEYKQLDNQEKLFAAKQWWSKNVLNKDEYKKLSKPEKEYAVKVFSEKVNKTLSLPGGNPFLERFKEYKGKPETIQITQTGKVTNIEKPLVDTKGIYQPTQPDITKTVPKEEKKNNLQKEIDQLTQKETEGEETFTDLMRREYPDPSDKSFGKPLTGMTVATKDGIELVPQEKLDPIEEFEFSINALNKYAPTPYQAEYGWQLNIAQTARKDNFVGQLAKYYGSLYAGYTDAASGYSKAINDVFGVEDEETTKKLFKQTDILTQKYHEDEDNPIDLFKKGKIFRALDVGLRDALRNLPVTATAMIGAMNPYTMPLSFAAMSIPSYGRKLNRLEENDIYDHMDQSSKRLNALLTGLSEGGSEQLGMLIEMGGAGKLIQALGRTGAKNYIAKSFMSKVLSKVGGILKTGSILTATSSIEGIEEYFNQMATNIVDNETGANKIKVAIDKGAPEAFVRGMMAAFFMEAPMVMSASRAKYNANKKYEAQLEQESDKIANDLRMFGRKNSEEIIDQPKDELVDEITEQEIKKREVKRKIHNMKLINKKAKEVKDWDKVDKEGWFEDIYESDEWQKPLTDKQKNKIKNDVKASAGFRADAIKEGARKFLAKSEIWSAEANLLDPTEAIEQKKDKLAKDINVLKQKVDGGEDVSQALENFENKKEQIKEALNEEEYIKLEKAVEQLRKQNEENVVEKPPEIKKETTLATENKIVKNSNKMLDDMTDKLEKGVDITPQIENLKEQIENFNIAENKKEQLRGRLSKLEQRVEDIGEEAKALIEEKAKLTKELEGIEDEEVIDEYKGEIKDLDKQIKEIREKNAKETELKNKIDKANKVIETTESKTFKQKQIKKVEKLEKELAELQGKEEIQTELLKTEKRKEGLEKLEEEKEPEGVVEESKKEPSREQPPAEVSEGNKVNVMVGKQVIEDETGDDTMTQLPNGNWQLDRNRLRNAAHHARIWQRFYNAPLKLDTEAGKYVDVVDKPVFERTADGGFQLIKKGNIVGVEAVQEQAEVSEKQVAAINKHNLAKMQSKEFTGVLSSESISGTAGERRAGVNFQIDKNGKVLSIGNPQNLSKDIQDKLDKGETKNVIVRVGVDENLNPTDYEIQHPEVELNDTQLQAMDNLETQLNEKQAPAEVSEKQAIEEPKLMGLERLAREMSFDEFEKLSDSYLLGSQTDTKKQFKEAWENAFPPLGEGYKTWEDYGFKDIKGFWEQAQEAEEITKQLIEKARGFETKQEFLDSQLNKENVSIQKGYDVVGEQEDHRITLREKDTNKEIGYIDFAVLDEKTEIQMIKVNPDYRGQGYSQMLYNEFQKETGQPIKTMGTFITPEGKGAHNKYIQTRNRLEYVWQQVQPAEVSEKQNPYNWQNENQEKVIHAGWDEGNSYRFVLEGTGDIFREFSKHETGEISKGYIQEKIDRINDYFDNVKKQRKEFQKAPKKAIQDLEKEYGVSPLETGINPADSYEYSQKQNSDRFQKMIGLWEEQPINTEEQRKARDLNLAMLKGGFDKAKTLVSEIQDIVSQKQAPVTPKQEGEQEVIEKKGKEAAKEKEAPRTPEGETITDEEIKRSERVVVYEVPLDKIQTDVDKFQNRSAEYSEDTVNRLVKAVKNNTYKWRNFQPALLWENNGERYVIAGHSRLEAFKRLANEGYKEFEKIPAKIYKGTKEEAIKSSEVSNVLNSPEYLIDRAGLYRKKLNEEGADRKKIFEEIRDYHADNWRKIVEYAHLNPDGIVMDALRRTQKATDKTASMDIEKIAQWIGAAKWQYRDKLTYAHEKEMFDYLKDTKKMNKIGTKKLFKQKIGHVVGGAFFNSNKELNLKGLERIGEAAKKYNRKMAEYKSELESYQDEILKFNKRLADAKEDENSDEIIRLQDKIDNINKLIKGVNRDIIQLKMKKGNYTREDLGQQNLIDLLEKFRQYGTENIEFDPTNGDHWDLKDKLDEKLHQKDIKGLLEDMVRTSENSEHVEMAKKFLSSVDEINNIQVNHKYKYYDTSLAKKEEAIGQFDPYYNSITFSTPEMTGFLFGLKEYNKGETFDDMFNHILLHEIGHAVATYKLMQYDINNKGGNAKLRGLNIKAETLKGKVLRAAEDINKVYEYVRNELAGENWRGLDSVSEFLSESISNKMFRERLRNLESPDTISSQNNIISAIRDFINKMLVALGLKQKTDVLTKAEKTMNDMINNYSYIKAESMKNKLASAIDKHFDDYYITDEIKKTSKEFNNVSPQTVLFADENTPTQTKSGESLRVTQKDIDTVKDDVISLHGEKWNITDIVEDGEVKLKNIETGKEILVDEDNFEFEGVEQKESYGFPKKGKIKKLVRYHKNDIVEYNDRQYFVDGTTNKNRVNLKDQQGNVVENVNKNALDLIERSNDGKKEQNLIDQLELYHGINGDMVDMVKDIKSYPNYKTFLQSYIIEQEGWRNIPTQYLNANGEQVTIAQSGEQFTEQVENRQAEGEEWGKVYSNYLLDMNQNSDVNTLEELFEEVQKLKTRVEENNTSFRIAKEQTLRELTTKEKKKLRKLYKKVFGKNYHKFQDVVKLVDFIEGNRLAVGAYKDGLIQIVKGEDVEDTLAHEIIHRVLDVSLTDAKRSSLINKMANKIEHKELVKYGIDEDGINIGKNYADFKRTHGDWLTSKEYIQYKKNLRKELAEEKLSEDFVEFAKSPEGFTGYIKNVYKKILNFVKRMLGRFNEIETFYDDVLRGKYADNGIETYEKRVGLAEIKYREKPKNDLQRRLDKYKKAINRLQNNQDSNAELTEFDKFQLEMNQSMTSTTQQRRAIHMLANKLGFNSDKHKHAYKQLMTIVSEKPTTLTMSIYEAKKAIEMLKHLVDIETGNVEKTNSEDATNPANREINTEEAYREMINSGNPTHNKMKGYGKKSNRFDDELDELWEQRAIEDEEEVKKQAKSDAKWKITAWQKEYYDFVDLSFWIGTKTGDRRVGLLGKTIEAGRSTKSDKYAKQRALLHTKHSSVLQKLNNNEEYFKKANKKLTNYFLKNEAIEEEELSELAEDLNKIMEWSAQVVRYKRPEMYFYGRLNLNDFHPEQQEILQKWGKTLGNFDENRLKYQALFNLIQKKGNPDSADMEKFIDTTGLTREELMEMYDESENFIMESYLPEDLEVMLQYLPEEDLYKFKRESLTIGRGHLISKLRQGSIKNSVVEKVLRTYRSTLTQRYVDMPVFKYNKMVKELLHENSYRGVRKQLRKIMGFAEPESGTAKALRNLMGVGYALYVAPRWVIQMKNPFQRLLNPKAKVRDFFKGWNKFQDEFSDDVVERFKNEMPQKQYIKERAALGMFATNRTKMIQDFKAAFSKHAEKEVEFGEYLLDRVGANWVANAFKHTIGEWSMNLMATLDRSNRANNMYTALKECEKVFSDKDLSWEQVEKKLGFGTLNETERHYLRSVAKFGGLKEFSWQYAKMETLKAQYQYDTALRNIWSNTGNVAIDTIMQYSTWPRGVAKKFWQTSRQLFTKKGDKVAAVKSLARMVVYGYMVTIIQGLARGKIRKRDDEPYAETVLKYGLRMFSPFDYAGSWNAGSLVPPPVNAYGIYNFAMNRNYYNELLNYGHITGILIGSVATLLNTGFYGLHSVTGNKKQARKSIKNLTKNFDKTLSSSFYPYLFVMNALDVIHSKRDANWIRNVIDKKYRPKNYERNGWEAITHIIFNSNAPKSKRLEKLNRLLGKKKNQYIYY